MRKRWLHTLLGLPALTLALASPREAAGWDDAHAYGIANFAGAGQCGTDPGLTHPVHEKTAKKFIETFNDLVASGDWGEAYERNNTSARGSYFTDSSKAGSCACTADDVRTDYGADEANVVFVHTHGGHSVVGNNSNIMGGSSSYDCYVYTDANMLLGNPGADLQIAIIKACQSGDYDVWQNGGYRPELTDSDSVFTVWNAFHGDSSCGSHVKSYVSSYSASSIYNGVGENWIDEAYDNAFWWWETDDCPVSIVMGANEADREHMYEYGGWKDREDTGSKTGSNIFYISGCDPTNGRVLP